MSQQPYSPYPSGPVGKHGGHAPVPPHLQPTNSSALIGFILALVSFTGLGIFTAVPGLILGYKGRREIAQGQGSGSGLATAAIWIGWIVTALTVLAIIAFVVLVLYASTTTTSP